MEYKDYSPTFRNVLIEKVRPEQLNSGLFVPRTDFIIKTFSDQFENEKEHVATDYMTKLVVLKVGKDCIETKVGDIIILSTGVKPQELEFDNNIILYSVYEPQIIGYERKE